MKEIFTWGNDAHTIRHDIEKNHRFVAKRFRKIAGQLQDITRRLTKRVYGKGITLSLSDMKYICGMEHHTAHNALEDAKDLYRITRVLPAGRSMIRKRRPGSSSTFTAGMSIISIRDLKSRRLCPMRQKPAQPGERAGEKKETGETAERMLKEISMQYIDALKDCYRRADGHLPAEIWLCATISGVWSGWRPGTVRSWKSDFLKERMLFHAKTAVKNNKFAAKKLLLLQKECSRNRKEEEKGVLIG